MMTSLDVMRAGEPEDSQSPTYDWPLLIFVAALPVGVFARLAAGWNLPLWFDETFTGVVASQPDFAGLLRWCLMELTGPAFYMPMWIWAKIAGISDVALRVPAVFFSIATPLVIVRYGHPDRTIRLFWAALTLLWLPVLPMATEARPYPQILFLGTLQAILFLKLVSRPSPLLYLLWGTATALAVLTHSYALVIGGLQGIALLVSHRRALFSLYPMVFPLGLMCIWMAYQLPFILDFAAGHVAHYLPIRPKMLFTIPIMILGEGIAGYIVIFLVFLSCKHWKGKINLTSPEALLIWSGIGAATIIISVGLFGATLMPRYLTAGIPALLFGVAYWARIVLPHNAVFVRLAFVALFATMLVSSIAGPFDLRFRERRHFQFETASAWLMERSPDRLHFQWPTLTGAQSPPENLAQVAGFFFGREGRPVAVIVEGRRATPAIILAKAARHPRSAILWISDNPLSAGRTPRVGRHDRRWECRDFGGEKILVYACRTRSP